MSDFPSNCCYPLSTDETQAGAPPQHNAALRCSVTINGCVKGGSGIFYCTD